MEQSNKCKGCIDNEREINGLKVEIEKIKSDSRLSDYKHEQTMKLLKEIQEDVKEIKDSPNKMKWIMITAIASAFAGFVIPLILKK